MERLTSRFLEGLAESMDSLSCGADSISLNPAMALASALILTWTVAFSHTLKLPLIVFSLSLFLVLSTGSNRISWIRLQLFTILWAIIIAAPLPFIEAGEPVAEVALGSTVLNISIEGLNRMMTFVARVSAATAIFTAVTSMIGWRGIIDGLERLKTPRDVIFLLNIFIINIPLFLRKTLNMLSAREARLVARPKPRDIWRLTCTVVGEVILRGYEHAWRLEKAIKARYLSEDRKSQVIQKKVRVSDLLLLSAALLILTLKLGFPTGL
ncbi:MAG: energy-coupling factor transporter transmembrane component T [Candidatus Bathyarchaeia archaeon]